MKRGTATVSADELRRRGDRCRRSWLSKVVTRERAGRRWSRPIAPAGRTIAFANGCFDLLHVGHVRYLQARGRGSRSPDRGGERRCVGRELKGPGRPILPAADRAELVAALRGVDYVTIFPRTDRRRRF